MMTLLLLVASVSAAPLPKLPKESKTGSTVSKVIWQGRAPTAAELSHTVTIEFLTQDKEPESTHCSGVLITPNVAATAGHCFGLEPGARPFKPRTVIFHGPDGAPAEKLPAIAGAPHEGFKPELDGVADVGFVVFKGALPAGRAPAPLLEDEASLKVGARLFAVGSGRKPARDGKLMAADLTLLQYRPEISQFAAGGEKVAMCGGDSGGPAFLAVDGALHVAGLTSHSIDDASCLSANVTSFIAVPRYRAWLLSAARAAQERLSAPR